MIRPHRTSRMSRQATAAITVLVLATACTDSNRTDPLPTDTGAVETPTTTDSPTVTEPATPTPAEVIAIVDEYRKVLLTLPELPPADAADHIASRAAALTTEDGTARTQLLQQAEDLAPAATASVLRGQPHTHLLDTPTRDGSGWTATGCVARSAILTDVATGETEIDLPEETRFTRAELRVVATERGGSWVVDDYTESERDDRVACIPPSIQESVTDSWEAFTAAWAEWERRGGTPDDLGDLADLTTDAFAELLRGMGGIDPVPQADQTAASDLRLEWATASEVRGDWCRGQRLDRGVWRLVDDTWLVSDAGRFGTEPEEDHRCS